MPSSARSQGGASAPAGSEDCAAAPPSSKDGTPATAWPSNRAPALAWPEDGASVSAPAEDGASVCSYGRAARWISASDRTVPTANQRRWDARRYSLDLTVDPLGKTIAGTTVVHATVLADSAGNAVSLPYLELDLDDALAVTAAWYQGSSVDTAAIHHADHLLRIPFSRPAQTGDTIEVMIRYQGTPPAQNRDGLNFSTVDGRPMAWSFGGPRGARRWWPCKDYPEDKADLGVSLRVTVPRSFEVVANGRLLSETATDTTVTFDWLERHSIATYLVSFTAYPYSVYEDQYHPADSPADSMPIVFYNVPSAQRSWMPVQAQVKTMIGAFAEKYGEYPFLD
jgi:aminopeptidase N